MDNYGEVFTSSQVSVAEGGSQMSVDPLASYPGDRKLVKVINTTHDIDDDVPEANM